MGPRRLGIALVAALVISLGITSVFYVRIARTQGSSRPKTRRIIAAAVALQPGAPIAVENLTEIDWPQNVPLEGLIENTSPSQCVSTYGVLDGPILSSRCPLTSATSALPKYGLV